MAIALACYLDQGFGIVLLTLAKANSYSIICMAPRTHQCPEATLCSAIYKCVKVLQWTVAVITASWPGARPFLLFSSH